MHKDANLRKRNALVIPGGLLAAYSVAGMAYVALLRTDEGTCGDASLMVFAGACRSAVLVMGIPLVIGLALALVGAFTFRSLATCRSGHGSWTHFTLALLISLVVVPALGVGLAPSLVGEDAAIARGGVNYPVTSILGGLSVVGALILIPFAFLYAGQTRANPCCREKGCFAPCFCDEPATEEPPAEEALPPEAPAAAAPAVAATPQPNDDWQVVDETPPTPTPTPPPSPAEPSQENPPSSPPSTTGTASTLAGAPALATRPSDPAAPPSDEMAHAVEWTQVDDDEDDLGDDEPEEAATAKPRKARRPAAKSASRTTKKKTAKSSKK